MRRARCFVVFYLLRDNLLPLLLKKITVAHRKNTFPDGDEEEKEEQHALRARTSDTSATHTHTHHLSGMEHTCVSVRVAWYSDRTCV